jgi:hypothetical protein
MSGEKADIMRGDMPKNSPNSNAVRSKELLSKKRNVPKKAQMHKNGNPNERTSKESPKRANGNPKNPTQRILLVFHFTFILFIIVSYTHKLQ